MMKMCSGCLEDKDLDEFYNKKNGLLGKHAQCKTCLCLKNKEWKKKNPEKVRINNESYYEKLNSQYKKSTFKDYGKEIGKNFRDFERYAERKMRNLANTLINYGIRCGCIIKKDKCGKCDNNINVKAYLSDYSKPLQISWICVECDSELH